MNTTVITDTRAPEPGTRAPRRQAPRRDDPRRLARRRHDPGRAPAEGLRTRPAGGPSGAAPRAASRTPFILLVLALLGCGLVCLLVINTTLAAASFRISNLQQENTQASQRVQELQQQVSADRSANSIERRALGLGMRLQPTLNFIDLRTGRTYTAPLRARGVYAVPGYTP